MEIKEFLRELLNHGWGVATFNTYRQDGTYCFFIIVAQSGDSGNFMKKEGLVSEVDNAFVDIVGELGDY